MLNFIVGAGVLTFANWMVNFTENGVKGVGVQLGTSKLPLCQPTGIGQTNTRSP